MNLNAHPELAKPDIAAANAMTESKTMPQQHKYGLESASSLQFLSYLSSKANLDPAAKTVKDPIGDIASGRTNYQDIDKLLASVSSN